MNYPPGTRYGGSHLQSPLGKLRQKGCEFEASLGYKVKHLFQKEKRKKTKTTRQK